MDELDRISFLTDIGRKEILSVSRKEEVCYARMIYALSLHRFGMKNKVIARLINRDRTTVNYYLAKINDLMKYNKKFLEMYFTVEKNDFKLNKTVLGANLNCAVSPFEIKESDISNLEKEIIKAVNSYLGGSVFCDCRLTTK